MDERLSMKLKGFWLPMGLGVVAFLAVASTIADPGLTWDEANFLPSMASYAEWYKEVFSSLVHGGLRNVLSKDAISARWWPTHENPPFANILSMATTLLTQNRIGPVAGARLATAIQFALITAVAYKLAARLAGTLAGTFSALSLLGMPRLFGHAHFAALDITMALTSLLITYAFLRGTESWRWSVAAGVFFGLALATKLNAFFLPLPLLIWGQVFRRRHVTGNITAMVLLGPLVWVLVWPWLWHDTMPRLLEYLASKVERISIPVYYLGVTYDRLPAPWHYPIIMTLVTLPAGITIFAAAGAGRAARNRREAEAGFLLLLSLAGALGPFFLPSAQKYDGVRLFLPAFPLIACLAGGGLDRIVREIARKVVLWTTRGRQTNWQRCQARAMFISTVLGLGLLMPSIVATRNVHPYQLSYYNVLAGGLRGARQLGFETTYWGDACTDDFLRSLSAKLPDGVRVAFHPCGANMVRYYKACGFLRNDIVTVERTQDPDYLVLIWRQGFFDDELWTLVQCGKPIFENRSRGVPLVSVYKLQK